jgi:hypothetical protein
LSTLLCIRGQSGPSDHVSEKDALLGVDWERCSMGKKAKLGGYQKEIGTCVSIN